MFDEQPKNKDVAAPCSLTARRVQEEIGKPDTVCYDDIRVGAWAWSNDALSARPLTLPKPTIWVIDDEPERRTCWSLFEKNTLTRGQWVALHDAANLYGSANVRLYVRRDARQVDFLENGTGFSLRVRLRDSKERGYCGKGSEHAYLLSEN